MDVAKPLLQSMLYYNNKSFHIWVLYSTRFWETHHHYTSTANAAMLREHICWLQGSSFKGFSIVFQKSNRMWFFGHFFAPYLQQCNKNNTSDKLRSTFWREKNVQKTKFEAAEIILDPWNQQI